MLQIKLTVTVSHYVVPLDKYIIYYHLNHTGIVIQKHLQQYHIRIPPPPPQIADCMARIIIISTDYRQINDLCK